MGSPLPLEGVNPYTGMYQARQFGVGNLSPTPNYVASYLVAPPSAMVTAQGQTPLVEQAEFWGLNVQTATKTGSPTGGTFVLQYGVNFTGSIAYNATAATVQAALNALSSIDGGINAVQNVTITGAPTGGTFTLTFGGQTTAGIAFGATNTAVKTALTALSSIGANNVTVTGPNGGPFVVTFVGALANAPQATITASGASLTGGTSPGVTVASATTGVAPITVAGSAGGPWTITFGALFANQPIELIRVRSTALTGGRKPNVVVTSSAQQQGISPF